MEPTPHRRISSSATRMSSLNEPDRSDPSSANVGRVEVARSEVARAEVARSEVGRAEVARSEIGRVEGGVAELIENGLVWLDGLRDRRGLSTALTVLLGLGLTIGWAAAQWRGDEPVDDRITPIQQWSQNGSPFESAVATEVPVKADGGAGADGEQTVASVASEGEPVDLVVHVSGAVVAQGLVALAPGSRLADAITAAGGATPQADIHRLNLATPLSDGMHIRVPEIGERDDAQPLPLIEQAGEIGHGPQDPTGAEAEGGAPVNVNTASRGELERLPGIGPALAAAIVSWREENGPFGSVDGLLDVPGIGPAKLAALQDQVTL